MFVGLLNKEQSRLITRRMIQTATSRRRLVFPVGRSITETDGQLTPLSLSPKVEWNNQDVNIVRPGHALHELCYSVP